MAVVGDELYVSDYARDCIHAFSFAGEHLREIRGDWHSPQELCFANERLYLIEQKADDDGPEGKRIFVLTPQGETLQIYSDLPNVQRLDRLAVFGGKLLVTAWLTNEHGQDGDGHIFALQGL